MVAGEGPRLEVLGEGSVELRAGAVSEGLKKGTAVGAVLVPNRLFSAFSGPRNPLRGVRKVPVAAGGKGR